MTMMPRLNTSAFGPIALTPLPSKAASTSGAMYPICCIRKEEIEEELEKIGEKRREKRGGEKRRKKGGKGKEGKGGDSSRKNEKTGEKRGGERGRQDLYHQIHKDEWGSQQAETNQSLL